MTVVGVNSKRGKSIMPTNNTNNNNNNNQQNQSAPKKSLPTGDIIGKRRGVFELDKKKQRNQD